MIVPGRRLAIAQQRRHLHALHTKIRVSEARLASGCRDAVSERERLCELESCVLAAEVQFEALLLPKELLRRQRMKAKIDSRWSSSERTGVAA